MAMRKTISIVIAIGVVLLALSCSETITPPNDPPDTPPLGLSLNDKQLAQSSNEFGFKLFKNIAGDDGGSNILISPLSISMALGMTLNGAAGETLEAMRETLEFSGMTEDEINKSYRNLIDFLGSLDPKVKLEIANSIWARLEFVVEQEFLDINQSFFDAEVRQLDFGDPSTVDTINAWVSENTNGKIESIIESISRDVVMYLINAVYFNAEWSDPFDTNSTINAAFYKMDGTITDCKLMRDWMDVPHVFNDELKAVELTYGDGTFGMVLILPNHGVELSEIIEQLDDEWWSSLVDLMVDRNLDISLPRFKFEFEDQLKDNLSSLGMDIAFDAGRADFTKINRNGGLFISRVKHKTFIRANEFGTEAAAVTLVEISRSSLPDPDFLANRPFLFAIRERQSGSILFIGQVTDPGFE